MRRLRGSTFAGLGVAALAGMSCRPNAPVREAGAARESVEVAGARTEQERIVGPARLVPDVTAAMPSVLDVLPDGSRRLLVSGIRVLEHPDGRLERARQVLPNAPTRLLELPARLGGGLLIYVSAGATTPIWRAKSWLDRLDPLAEVWGQVIEIVAGFDRLYTRIDTGDFRAIDAQSGQQLPLDPLPRATRIGDIAFADPWRAVAIADFRGALATFDAGGSWRPVPLGGRTVTDLWLRDGEFILENQRERWRLGAAGELVKDDAMPDPARITPSMPSASRAGATPVLRDFLALPEAYGSARRPLRAAVEDGWPAPFDARGDSAIVAQAGALYRVDLASGAVLQWRADAFRGDDVTCHAIRLAPSFGFVCAAQTGGTALYAFEPPLSVREVARFGGARQVVPSGNGGFVVYGGCDRDAKGGAANRFCFSWPSGLEREIRGPAIARGAPARPVALADGRAAFIVPPNETGGASLLVGRGDTWTSVPIAFDDRDARLRRANWLDGIEEREPGVIAAWLLFDTELRGARVHLDGKIDVGRSGADVERTSLAGRYAVDWGATGRGVETVDWGMTWTTIDLPLAEIAQPGRPVTSCGPVGCAHQGWMRVGWGADRMPDLAAAPVPKPSRVALSPARGISLRCELTGQVAGPGASAPRPNDGAWRPPSPSFGISSPFPLSLLPLSPPTHVSPMLLPLARSSPPVSGSASLPLSGWTPFRGSPAPPLREGEIGLEAGTDPQVTMQARIYAWGPRGPGWSRLAQAQARFDDRFDFYGTRSTRPSGGFWSDEDRAADALGLLPAHTVNWAAILDPSGQAALLFAQQGAGRADLYAAAQGESLVEWHSADGSSLPVPSSVVRLGPAWFFLATSMTTGAWVLSAYRVDSGVVRRLARFPRVPAPASEAGPKLMRRAGGDALGLLVQGAPGFEQTIRDWYALPLDPATGELGEPERLVSSDLEGLTPVRCAADADVWWVNTELTLSPAVELVGPPLASLSAIELRLGLAPNVACIESMAARGDRLSGSAVSPTDGEAQAALSLPMVATDSTSGRRWLLRCGSH